MTMTAQSKVISAALVLSVTGAMAPATSALAQRSTSGAVSLMEEVVVTARKREEIAQTIPVSMNAFAGEQLTALGVTESKDVAKIAPGLQWKSDSPFGGNNIFVRGVGNNTTLFTSSPAVAVYLDETYFNSQAFHGFTTFDMERVEVLKGPQGTLYGRNTTGGAIKYVSRKPQIGGGVTGDINLDLGNFGLRKIEGGIGTDIGAKSAMRVGFSSHDRGGIYYDYLRDTQTTDINAKAVRLQFRTEPSEKLSILVSGNYGRSRSDDIRFKRSDTVDPASISFGPNGPGFSARCANPGIGTAPGCTSLLQLFGVPDDLNTDAFEVQSNLTRSEALERIESWGAALTVEYDLGFATFTSATAYFDLSLDGPQDVDGTALNIVSIFDNADVEQITQEFRLTSSADGPLQWVVGAYYFNESILQLKPVNIAPLGIGFGNTGDQETDSVSIFGEGTYSLTPKLDLTVGLRWSRDKRHVDFTYFNYLNDGVSPLYSYADIVNGPGFAPGTFTLDDQKKSWSNVSGRFIASYQVTPDVLTYASFNRGYKGGEFNFGSDTPATATFVDPETVDAYEVGVKSELFGRKLRFNAAAFYYDYKDKQETLFDTGTATLSNADARVKGIDLDVTAIPVPGLTLHAGLALLDAKYKDFPSCRPDGTDCDGNYLPMSPKRVLNLLARYEFDVAGRLASIQANSTYTSSRYFDFRNVSYIAADSYWLVDARASYQLMDNVEAALWVRNIGNERYLTDGFDVSNFGYSLLLGGIPRTYGGTVSIRF